MVKFLVRIFHLCTFISLLIMSGMAYAPLSRPTSRQSMSAQYSPNVSRCAEGNQNYCTSHNGYPVELLERLLRQNEKYVDSFISDELVLVIGERMGFSSEVNLCDSYEEVVYPTIGKTESGDKFIFNTPNHKQGVRINRCQNPGKSCTMTESFPTGYRTECKQHYVYRELVSLGNDGNSLVREKFKMPACCSCVVYKV